MQYNIYFRKDNWAKFEQEENKSKLINELLDKHYGQFPIEDRRYPSVRVEVAPTKTKEITSHRPRAKILAEIRETERLRDEELEFCQDDAERKRITNDAQEVLDELWSEHKVVADE